MRRLFLFLTIITIAAAQGGGSGSLGVFTASAVGTAQTYNVAVHKHTMTAIPTGSPSTCTIRLEGSIDGTNFFDLSGSQDCSSALMFHVVDKPVTWVRANLTALTGGTNPTVTVRYLGVQ